MACRTCRDRNIKPSEWFSHIWQLHLLQRGGYPFTANDLDLEEWIDLGTLREEIDNLHRFPVT